MCLTVVAPRIPRARGKESIWFGQVVSSWWVGSLQKSGEMTLLHVYTKWFFHPQRGSAQSRCAGTQLQAEGIREQPQKQAGRCHSSSAYVRGSTENLRIYHPTSFSQHSYSRLISEAWNLTQSPHWTHPVDSQSITERVWLSWHGFSKNPTGHRCLAPPHMASPPVRGSFPGWPSLPNP